MKYLAIRVKRDIVVLNNRDELWGLNDLGIEHEVIGTVCDEYEYGDRCNTDCYCFARGTCPAQTIRDAMGNLWHVIK